MPPGHSEKATRLAENCDTPGFEYISKSRLTTFETCPRKFAIQYVAGHRPEETYPMRKGTALHGAFEDYYLALNQVDGELPGLATLLPHTTTWPWGPFAQEHVLNFLDFEAERLSSVPALSVFTDVRVESELWWDEPTVDDSPPWFGYVDAIYPAESFPWTDHDTGYVVADFKTGKTPKERYRETGIYLELEFYRILAEQTDIDVVAMAGYYPQANDVLVVEPSASRENTVFDLVEDMLSLRGEDPNNVEKDEQPLCNWGRGMCDFYRHGKEDADAWEGQCDSTWGLSNGKGPTY